VVKGAPHRKGALAFVRYVLSDRGKSVLDGAGFQAP
jgi:ABC-type molybdate transport system substrate-binding protein